MQIDSNVFYRKVTLALCSNLELTTSLANCFEYLHSVLPLDRLVFGLYDSDACAIKRIASVDHSGTNNALQCIPLPAHIGKVLQDNLHITDRLIGNTQNDPISAAVAPYVGNQGCSVICLPLLTKDDKVGYLVLQVKGYDLYTEEHMQLMSMVRKPLNMALANALLHQELVALKNQLEKDKQGLEKDKQDLEKELFLASEKSIIGAEEGLGDLMEMVRQVAPLQNTVLLLGETGVGKEVIANELHRLSPRKDGPFIKVNCGAIPENLIDSELFGHEKGAFTGAMSLKRGRFERAHGGTIFLDEIGELPPAAQIRLLRVLQTHEIERVGGVKNIPVDIRVIAATHRDLEKRVGEGLFREDLWFRINVFPIIIPPLRQRREDVPLLVKHFLESKAKELGYRDTPQIVSGALTTLMEYSWPGNVRELENVVERALIQSRGRDLQLNCFNLSRHSSNLGDADDSCGCVFPCLAKSHPKSVELSGDNAPPLTLEDLVARHIRQVLQDTYGKINGAGGAAELLGLKPSTLRNRMDRLGISYGRRAETS